ncbi:hypothetical protein C0J52_10533 [Blattella germanica]|nr:hypothetical protein C0J52_10533 [Blattella germanica]
MSRGWKQGEDRFIGPHYVFPLLLSPLSVVLAQLDTPLHICFCDQGTVFQPLFCFSDVVCPCIEYALMTLDTVSFDTPTTFATVTAESPTINGHQQSCLFGILSGHKFHCTTCIPRHSQLKFLLLREEEGPHDTLKTKKDHQLQHVLYRGGPNLRVLFKCVSIILSTPCVYCVKICLTCNI